MLPQIAVTSGGIGKAVCQVRLDDLTAAVSSGCLVVSAVGLRLGPICSLHRLNIIMRSPDEPRIRCLLDLHNPWRRMAMGLAASVLLICYMARVTCVNKFHSDIRGWLGGADG